MEKVTQDLKTLLLQWFSMLGSWTSTISITRTVKNVNSQALPQTP